MATDPMTIQLSVWRPARLGRRLLPPSQDGASAVPFEDEHLQEEAYSWETREDFPGSLKPDDAGKVRAALFEAFAPHLRPIDRSIAKLEHVIETLAHGCVNSREVAWQDTLTLTRDRDENVNLRANPALSLLHHLRWVHDVFRDVPGASVIVR
jgi:hypothetical protein